MKNTYGIDVDEPINELTIRLFLMSRLWVENISELELLLPIPKIAQFDFINHVDEEGKELTFYQKINIAAQQVNLAPLLA